MNTYTFLIEYRNGGTQTVRYSGESAEDAQQVALSSLSDADKHWLKAITVIATGDEK